MESHGIATWFDRSDIPGGASYGPEIAAGIRESLALVLMCSQEAIASRNVRQEIQLAWRYQRPILPLLLEPMVFPDAVVYWLEGAQWIEVLDQPPETWLPSVHASLARFGLPVPVAVPSHEGSRVVAASEFPPNNLPDAKGPLIIGREAEVQHLLALIDQGQLITLTGRPGRRLHCRAQDPRRKKVVEAVGESSVSSQLFGPGRALPPQRLFPPLPAARQAVASRDGALPASPGISSTGRIAPHPCAAPV